MNAEEEKEIEPICKNCGKLRSEHLSGWGKVNTYCNYDKPLKRFEEDNGEMTISEYNHKVKQQSLKEFSENINWSIEHKLTRWNHEKKGMYLYYPNDDSGYLNLKEVKQEIDKLLEESSNEKR